MATDKLYYPDEEYEETADGDFDEAMDSDTDEWHPDEPEDADWVIGELIRYQRDNKTA